MDSMPCHHALSRIGQASLRRKPDIGPAGPVARRKMRDMFWWKVDAVTQLPVVLITGANRGLGLALAREYAREGWSVIATYRDQPCDELEALAATCERVQLHPLDVSTGASVATLAAFLDERPLDVLINNAGHSGNPAGAESADGQAIGSIEYESWLQTLAVNTLGPMRVTESMIENLARSRNGRVIVITSLLGSIARASGGKYAYRTSKAAANMLVANLAVDLLPRGIIAAAFCPGWVQTRMGGSGAPQPPDQAAAKLRVAISRLTLGETGSFWNAGAERLPW